MDDEKGKQDPQFVQLFLKSHRRLYCYVMAIVASPSDADDIVQEVACVLWTKYDEYEPGTDFTAWAITIARHKIFNYLRSQKSHRRRFSQQSIEMIEQIGSEEGGKEAARIEAMRHCIRKLKKTEQMILSIRYEEGETLRNMARRLGLNINTLYSRLSRLHLMLLSCIERSMVE